MAGDTFDANGAAKYQFVVVAIVACGVFVAGVITIMYRRRRQQAYIERMGLGGFQGNTRLLLSENGVLVEVPTRRTPNAPGQPRKRRRLGPEPKLWDVEVGECDQDDDSESFESLSIDEKRRIDYVDVDEWQPVSIVLPPHTQQEAATDADTTPDPIDDPNADVTLLIAMPDRTLCCPADDGDLPLLHLPPSLCPRDADDFEEGGYAFPTVQLGTTNLRVGADWAELDALKPPKPVKPPRQPRQRREAARTPIQAFTHSLFRSRAGLP